MNKNQKIFVPLLFALCIISVVYYHGQNILISFKENGAKEESFNHIVIKSIGEETKQVLIKEINEREFIYGILKGGDYYIRSKYFASNVSGYGGSFDLGLRIQEDGILKNIIIIDHNETPEWIEKIEPWRKSLLGYNIFSSKEINDIDTVSGATFTTEAIRKILKKSGKKFPKLLNGNLVAGIDRERFSFKPDIMFLTMMSFTLLALLLRKYPQKKLRIFYGMTFIVTTFCFLQMQYSTYQIFSFYSFKFSVKALNLTYYFYIILPLLILLFGNFYCGYLCPFGLLQELTSDFYNYLGKKIFSENKKNVSIEGKFKSIKYILLVVLFFAQFVLKSDYLLKVDILRSIFLYSTSSFIYMILILTASLFINRVWCRYLCPVGAYLSVLNWVSKILYKKYYRKYKILKNLYYIPNVKRCDLGIEKVKEIGCINCDRCRYKCPVSKNREQNEETQGKIIIGNTPILT